MAWQVKDNNVQDLQYGTYLFTLVKKKKEMAKFIEKKKQTSRRGFQCLKPSNNKGRMFRVSYSVKKVRSVK